MYYFIKGDVFLCNIIWLLLLVREKCSIYGVDVTKYLSREFSTYNYGVVSGVANGIDSIAHKEVLIRGGKTIGVLGCGYRYSIS